MTDGVGYSFSNGADGVIPIAIMFGFPGYEDALVDVSFDEVYGFVNLILNVSHNILVAVNKSTVFKSSGVLRL